MSEQHVVEFEAVLGCRLPSAYREFLVSNTDSLLHPCLELSPPRSGVVDTLLTAEELLENNARQVSGIPEKGLLHIGGNILGGFLYLRVRDAGFGEVHYSERYMLKESFDSFQHFLDQAFPADD